MHKSQKIDSRPAYYDGQLLQAEDFIAEQRYHRHARRRHNTALHDWGIVSGLEVRTGPDRQITVQPGYAVDINGHEIDLPHPMTLETSGFAPHVRLRVTLYYRADAAPEREQRNRIDSHAVISVTDDIDDKQSLLLATLQIDAMGKPDPQSIDLTAVRRARTRLTPGSVGPAALSEELRRAWVAMPFRGWPLERGPDGKEALPPPFRQGTTEARSHDTWQGAANNSGAGGTMPVVLPFGTRRVLRMRLAGVENDDRIDFHLVRGGFDAAAHQHSRQMLLQKTIKGHPYNELFEIAEGELDPAWHTLSLWVRSSAKVSISLVAFEFGY